MPEEVPPDADTGHDPDAEATPDDVLAAALAAGKEVKEAAAAAGMSRRTAHRRLAEPGFRARVSQLRAELISRALGVLSDGMTEAAARLRVLLGSADEKVQLQAARSILEIAPKLREATDIEERLQALEASRK